MWNVKYNLISLFYELLNVRNKYHKYLVLT